MAREFHMFYYYIWLELVCFEDLFAKVVPAVSRHRAIAIGMSPSLAACVLVKCDRWQDCSSKNRLISEIMYFKLWWRMETTSGGPSILVSKIIGPAFLFSRGRGFGLSIPPLVEINPQPLGVILLLERRTISECLDIVDSSLVQGMWQSLN